MISWDTCRRAGAFLAIGSALAIPFVANSERAGAAEETTIKICAIDDASGDFALPVILKTDGAKLAVAEINAAGGVLGQET